MSTLLALTNDFTAIIAASGADTLTTQIRNFIAPFLLLAISIAAITFLFKREMLQFLMFLVIGLAVAAVFYSPQLITSIGQNAGEMNRDLTWK